MKSRRNNASKKGRSSQIVVITKGLEDLGVEITDRFCEDVESCITQSLIGHGVTPEGYAIVDESELGYLDAWLKKGIRDSCKDSCDVRETLIMLGFKLGKMRNKHRAKKLKAIITGFIDIGMRASKKKVPY